MSKIKRQVADLPPLGEWIDEMHGLFAQGMDRVEVATALNISMRAFNQFIEYSETFSEAVEYGEQLAQAYWHRLGREGASKQAKVDPTLFKANMGHRYQWSDKVETKTESNQSLLSHDELLEKVKEKLLLLMSPNAEKSLFETNEDITDAEYTNAQPLALELQESKDK